MMKAALGIAALALLLAGAAEARAGLILDQSFDGGTKNFVQTIYAPYDRAQTFTVGLAGTLAEIAVLVDNISNANADLLLDVRPTIAGTPTESDVAVLASATIPIASVPIFPTFAFVSVDISSFNVAVTPGEQLAIVLRSPLDTGGVYFWLGQGNIGAPAPYAGGELFIRSPGNGFPTWTAQAIVNPGDNDSLGFETFVNTPTAVPEPASFVLLGIGALGLLGYARRRHG